MTAAPAAKPSVSASAASRVGLIGTNARSGRSDSPVRERVLLPGASHWSSDRPLRLGVGRGPFCEAMASSLLMNAKRPRHSRRSLNTKAAPKAARQHHKVTYEAIRHAWEDVST